MLRLLSVFLSILVLSESIVLGGQGMLAFTVTPSDVTFMKGEPVQLIMSFYNQGEETINVNLGANGTENVRITVQGNNNTKKIVQGKIPGGISKQITIDIKPGVSRIQMLLLDEFLVLNEEGEYRVEIQVGKENRFISTTTVQIVPVVKEKLKQKLEKLWEKYNNFDTNIQERLIIEKILCLTKDENALEYQMKIVSCGSHISFEHFDTAVESMLQTKNPEAVKFLINNIVEKQDKNSPYRLVVLSHLRSLGIENWDQSTYKIIEPYKGEIEKAAPMVISD